MVHTNEINWDLGTDTLGMSFLGHLIMSQSDLISLETAERLRLSSSFWPLTMRAVLSYQAPPPKRTNLPWHPSCGLLSHLQLSRLQFHCVCFWVLSALLRQLQVSAAVALEEETKWSRFQTEWSTARRSLCSRLVDDPSQRALCANMQF